MLGFKNHAELSLATKMAPSVEAVQSMLDDLRDRCMGAAVDEFEELQEFAGSQQQVQPWDVPYWSERLREAKFDLNQAELQQYFALPRVLEGLFALASRLFGVTIQATPPDDHPQVWHPDVQHYTILQGGQPIASFFLDPYSRPGSKRAGAWMDVCVNRSDEQHRLPVAYLVCNQTPELGTGPPLMLFTEVQTLVHEFGHGLQHMLTTVEVGAAAGISLVEWDAVELPSLFMEFWCYHADTLRTMASPSMPDSLLTRLLASRKFRAASDMLRQLYFAALDMALHTQEDAADRVLEVQAEVAERFTVPQLPRLPEDRFLCSFGHIFAGGYR